MNTSIQLPITNDAGYYEMRLESMGGLGANLCGKLLGELGAMYLGLNAASFSSYGSEKRGSPVKAFIRWCDPDKELRINSPVQTPHLLGLFHEAMAGKHPVTAGVTEETRVVVNTDGSPEQVQRHLRLNTGELYLVDAQRIAMETKSRINMIMLGALSKASGFIPLDAVLQLVEDTLGKKYPDMLGANLEGVQRGYEETEKSAASQEVPSESQSYQDFRVLWGYENAPLGGVIPRIGSTVSNDLSASRQGYIPLFHPEKCIHCGLCDTTCPDMVFQFREGEYKGRQVMKNTGLDYHHCKGCLRCVSVCPTPALTSAKERDYPEKPHFVRNRDLIAETMEFETAGANSWVTSEAYLDEKRVDGGLQ